MPGYNPAIGIGSNPGFGSVSPAGEGASGSVGGGGGGGFPAGVTLVGPDGGVNFYANNGFAKMAAAGFDTTNFPIGPFNTDIVYTTSHPNTGNGSIPLYQALHWNTIFLDDGSTTQQTAMLAASIYTWGGAAGNADNYANIPNDEPNSWTASGSNQFPGFKSQSTVSNANQDNLPWYENFTVHLIDDVEIQAGTGQPATRTDAGCIVTSGASVVVDAATIGAGDVGKSITGTGIPGGTFIVAAGAGSVTLGTSVLYSYGSNPQLTGVNATSSGTRSLVVGATSTPSEIVSYPVVTPNGTGRHLDATGIDCYWMSLPTNIYLSAYYNFLGLSSITTDQLQRGTNYGFIVDNVRQNMNSVFPGPIVVYIDDGNAYGGQNQLGAAAVNVTPSQMNWATWGAIIHGARAISYFDHFAVSPAPITYLNVNYTYFQTVQSGQTVSIYQQVQNTDALILQMAPVLNSNNAVGFATVAGTAGTTLGPGIPWPTCKGNATSLFTGIDILVKYYQSTFYIFATTRNSEFAGPYNGVTFSLPNGPSSGTVTVIDESRTINISGGQFTDNFATGSTVHIYSIPQ